ncbi:MAG TPA: hypothetical protein DDY70_04060 [Clostridiales bacterium]|nr:hypothetical protein [Clostridiales bacterium]
MITIRIADLPIGIDNRYSYLTELCRDYLTDEEPLFTVRASDEELREESRISGIKNAGCLESTVVYRAIARKLPDYDALVFHGAVLAMDGGAYAFTAKSGTGKTTHLRLWLSEFGDEVHILNGDKPILRYIDGTLFAAGTPWRGKENYGRCEKMPLAAITFLSRGEKNTMTPTSPGDALFSFFGQIFMPEDEGAAQKTLTLTERILADTRLYRLTCNMDPEAAHVARRALSEKDGI